MPLVGVLLCHFHYEEGAFLPFQSPTDFLSKSDFLRISRFVIPKPEFFGKEFHMMFKRSGDTEEMQLMFYPLVVENRAYFRNSLMFSPVFLIDARDDRRLYSHAIQKLATSLFSMEEEALVLSLSVGDCRPDMKEAEPSAAKKMQTLLDTILSSLHSEKGVDVVLDGLDDIQQPVCFRLSLHLPATSVHIPRVCADQVPIVVCRDALRRCAEVDVACLRVARFIDGVRTASGIALVAHMELQLALYVFRCLVYARAIVLTDPMLLCNVRTTTSKLKDLMRDANMQSECKDFVCRNNTVVSIEDIVRLYSQFSPSKKLTPHTFATASKNSEILDDIHLRRFFQYGSLRGILHCTRTYPVLVDEREGCDDGDKDNEENTSGTRHINDSIDNCFISPDIAKLCTGEFSLEEISAIRRQSREHLRMKLYADKRIHLLNA
eukprot:m.42690 g.42690  ORF g.42690 m.42690 type:complete len:435 (-) comp10527_c0_seq4:189-1493(-)